MLVGSGGLLASMDGVAFASSGLTRSHIATLQVGYIAESLAVKVYSWAKALGPKHTPKGFRLHIPAAAVNSTKGLTSTGVVRQGRRIRREQRCTRIPGHSLAAIRGGHHR